MVEELKLAIKIDDDAIEQSLLKQFNNAEKMADKVVLTFKNINLDDKNIEAKFKEMQKMAGKNPIDFSISDKSVEMLSAISKQLSNIFEIAKSKSLIDSSSTVSDIGKIANATNQQIDAVKKTTSAYKNQAYELASVLKMLEKMDRFNEVSYAGSMSKAIKANAKSYKKDDIIQFSSKDYNISEEALKQLRGLSVNLEEAFNYSDTLGLDTATIKNVEVLIQYFRELLKEKLEFNNTKLNTADIEELIKALGIAKKEVFDDGTGKKINSYDGYLNKYSSVSEIISFLKQQEQQALATAEAEQKLANVEQQSSNSSLAENQDKIQQELKETEKVAEQTVEALEKVNSNGNKSNISSGKPTTPIKKDDLDNVDDLLDDLLLEDGFIEELIGDLEEEAEATKKASQADEEYIETKKKLNSLLEGMGLNPELDDELSKENGLLKEQSQEIIEIENALNTLTDRYVKLTYIIQSASDGWDGISDSIKQALIQLKLFDETGKFLGNFNEQGMAAQGAVMNGTHAIIARRSETYDRKDASLYNYGTDNYLDLLIKKEQEAYDNGVNLARILSVIDGYDGIYEIQEQAKGSQVHDIARYSTLESYLEKCKIITEATDEQLKKLLQDVITLNNLGFKLDFGVGNILYDKENGFSLIDLELRELDEKVPETQDLIRNLFKSLSGGELMEKYTNSGISNFVSEDNLQRLNAMLSVAQRLQTVFDVSKVPYFDAIVNAQKEVSTNLSKTTIEDVFQNDSDSSSIVKEEASVMEQVETATEQAVQAKKDFATANEGVQDSVADSKSPLQLEAELMQQIAKDARDAADAKKEFVEANKQVKDSAEDSNETVKRGHSENAEPSGTKKYKKKGYRAHDTGNHDNEVTVTKKSELGKVLKDLQTEIIASLDETTSFIKEVTDFYDSADNLVKTQMKVVDKDGSQRTYTTSYSTDKDGNTTAWTSHIDSQKFKNTEEQEAKEIQKAWDDAEKAITEYLKAKTKLNTLEATDIKSGNVKDQIDAQKQKVEELEVEAENARKVLSNLLGSQDIDTTTWNNFLKLMKDFEEAGKGSSQSIAKIKDAIANVNTSELQTIDKYIESAQKKLDSTKSSRDDSEKSSYFKTYEKDAQECINAIIAERNRLENAVKSGDIELIDERSLSNLNNLKQKLEEANSGFKTMFKGSAEVSRWKEIDTITKYMEKNTRISKEAKDELREYIETLKINGADADVEEIHKAFLRVCDGERKAKREGQSFLDVLRDKVWYQWAAQIGSYFSLNDILNYGKQAASIVTELNTQITDLAKVSEATSKQIYADFDSYADIAKDIGGTISDTISATTDWAKNGYSIPDAKELARVSQLYKNVGDGIDIDSANESLISTLKGFQLEAEQAEHIVDVFNEVDILASYYSNVIALCA